MTIDRITKERKERTRKERDNELWSLEESRSKDLIGEVEVEEGR